MIVPRKEDDMRNWIVAAATVATVFAPYAALASKIIGNG
jgi:hypothetical protein